MPRTLDPFRFLLVAVARWMNQPQQQAIEYLQEENRIFRAQLGSNRLRLADDQRRSLAAKAKLRRMLAELATIVTPETLLRWHRKLIANKYDGSVRRKPGRPATAHEIEALVVRMATENRAWGYLRIQGALANLGHDLARSTIANIRKRNSLPSGVRPEAKTVSEISPKLPATSDASEMLGCYLTSRTFTESSRHTCAMIVLQATQDIRRVSLWLGHSSLGTTEVYVRADPTEKLEAIEAIVPPSNTIVLRIEGPDSPGGCVKNRCR
jgi:hypothetical protein